MTNPFPLKGETVTITKWHPISRGHFKEYQCYYRFTDERGNDISGSVKFHERIAKVFRAAGHTKFEWSFTHKTHNVAVNVVLGTTSTKRGERYSISHVYSTDGIWHDVDAQTNTQAVIVERATPTADSPIFAHGEKVIRDWLAERAGFEAQVYQWIATTTLKQSA